MRQLLRRVLVLGAMLGITATIQAEDWPQWLGTKRDAIWRETGIVDQFPASGLKPTWKVSIGQGYAGPAVAAGKVFVTDRVLNRGSANPANPFDSKTPVGGVERVLCLNEQTGEIIWKHEYPCTYRISYASGPRCTPTVDGDFVYTLGAMGDLFCLETATGKVVWSKNFIKDFGAEPPVWGFSSHPLVDGNKLICLVGGSQGRLVMAFDKRTGETIWKGHSCIGDFGYAPPVIYQVGQTRQLIIWHPQAVMGLDPETGKKFWQVPFESKFALTAPMARYDDGRLFVTAFYNGPLMLKLDTDKPGASILWKGKSNSERPDKTDGLHSIMPTPLFHGDTIYGICSYGELRGLDANTGKRLWADMRAASPDGEPLRWGNAFLVENGDRVFLFNERGELIIAKLSREGYTELSRTKLLEPTNKMAPGRPAVVWMHPAFANKAVIARNDQEIVRYSLAK
ncbi:PQQ-binding-like beta-propeller repeat protein [Tuwongella immobilis]|uniref:Pyrrolo-quinoline quinone repeat domain-containing protein n=1 Tax=Tuwongella immobilis TaxID=692036 RepID=A0A6C2YWH2_9BACT|nr:PQQ-binding-like beta-propeller repeat protein [Tuwongella immobilis]VIP05741.1 Pyrrolo-quinoline quinone OS=Pedosphaera parvula (strain Ellin514) GN=Cflav_PD3587 PE=4 SV=1: PQQ_2 [Tuwongella immobilis]VTS08838.1 Pyrrolo-quinoline quinone OS=Pedosphaera parvula (strain Ellin514) GN=Cflav_PD3587 PE=4 SV=1: PQQ_2 [Tuwongella immobilis]